MVGTYLTPGVYVEELPGGARAIEGVATSVTLLMGYTLRGPTQEAVRIASWGEYERKFGGVVDGASVGINDLRAASKADARVPDVDYMGHEVFAYFQNGGGVAYIRRMVEGDPAAAAPAKPTLLTTAKASIVSPRPLTFSAADAGGWANGLVIEIKADDSHPGNFMATIGRLNAKGELVPIERFDDAELAAGGNKYLGTVLARQSNLVRLDSTAVPAAIDVSPDVQHGVHRSPVIAAVPDLSAAVAAARTFKVQLDPAGNGSTDAVADQIKHSSLEALAANLEARVRAQAGTTSDAQALARRGATVRVVRDDTGAHLDVTSGYGAPDSKAVVMSTAGSLGATLGFTSAAGAFAPKLGSATVTGNQAVLYAGSNGFPAQTSVAYNTALGVLELNPDVNVILTPNAAWDDKGKPIVETVIAHCQKMKNRVTIIDPPRDSELTDPTKINQLVLPTSTYTQLYYPWILVANPNYHPVKAPGAPTTVLVPPSGYAAGMWSRIDAKRGVWKAPAGVEALLLGVDGFRYDVGDPQQEVLNPAGVNVMRLKPGYGRVIWGARTLATNADPEWRYIPVRRTAIMIEEALRRGIQWAVFEPNDDRLWSSLRLSSEAYMQGLFRSGAFQGLTSSQAYQVECGLGKTMDQGDIDRGYVILRVKFRPLKPAEFVVIQIQQLAGQA